MGKSHKDNKSVSRSKKQFKRRFAEIEHDLETNVVEEELEELLADGDEGESDGDKDDELVQGVSA